MTATIYWNNTPTPTTITNVRYVVTQGSFILVKTNGPGVTAHFIAASAVNEVRQHYDE